MELGMPTIEPDAGHCKDGNCDHRPGSPFPGRDGYVTGTCGHAVAGSEWRAGFRSCERCPADAEQMVPCPTCNGTGQCEMRGESHRDYDEPNYMDTCGICGGEGELPASMFSDAEDDDERDDEV